MEFGLLPTSSQGITLAAGASVAALFLINRWASNGVCALDEHWNNLLLTHP
jgi:hypothetical protein